MAVAGFGSWHQLNEEASAVLDEGAALPAHALWETYSVLTGFPPPHRAPPGLVQEWLDDRFETILASPSTGEQRRALGRLASAGRTGGAVYDALVALTVKGADAVLVTADRRAAATYDLMGVEVRFLAGA